MKRKTRRVNGEEVPVVYWSYAAGQRKVNRVRVYQDRPGSVIRIEWFNPTRKRQVLRSPKTGIPVTDKKLAMKAADFAAGKRLEKLRATSVAELFGHEPIHTFGELVAEYHKRKEHNPLIPETPKDQRWGYRTTAQQRRYRDFWLAYIPKSQPLGAVQATTIEEIAETQAVARGWKAGTWKAYLVYVVDAFRYAKVKLQWLSTEPLSAVSLPGSVPFSPEYSETEAKLVLDACLTVDARASAAGEIAYCSGTRISSLLGVRAEQVHFVEIDGRRVGAIEITWDKTRRGRMILLSSAASAAVGRLLQWPEVQRTGWLFASKRGDQPVSDTKMRELLHEAERLAGVPEVKGRAFHGFKRSFASADIELEDASLQSGTAPDMLRRRYRKANLRRMLRVVDEIDRVRAVVPTEVDA